MSIKTKEILEFMIRQDNKMDVMQKQIDGMDMLLTELNHALPEYDAECEEAAIAASESLARHAVRPGLAKLELKVLDQSVFDGLDKKWQWASFDKNGSVHKYEKEPFLILDMDYWGREGRTSFEKIQGLEGVGDWKKSLIKREAVELIGSDLCLAMLGRGDRFVMCFISNNNNATAEFHEYIRVINGFDGDYFTIENPPSPLSGFRYAIPINNNGNVLTQKEAGL